MILYLCDGCRPRIGDDGLVLSAGQRQRMALASVRLRGQIGIVALWAGAGKFTSVRMEFHGYP